MTIQIAAYFFCLIALLPHSLWGQSETAAKNSQKPVIAQKPEAPAKGYLLNYRFQKGESLHYQSGFQMKFITAKGRTKETVISKTEMKKHFKVIAAKPDGSVILEPILDHVKMSAKFNETEPITFDSSSKITPPKKYQHVAESVGTAMVHLKINQQGKLLDVIPQKTIKERSVVTLTSGDRDDQMTQKNFLINFPVQPIKIGGTWTEELNSTVTTRNRNLKKPVKLQREYRLKSVKKNIALIIVKTSLLTNIRNPQQMVQLIQRTPRGTILFDIKRGILISRKTEIDNQVFGIAGGDSYAKATSSFQEVFVEKK